MFDPRIAGDYTANAFMEDGLSLADRTHAADRLDAPARNLLMRIKLAKIVAP